MSEEMKSVPTQEAQDNVAQNEQSSSSDSALLQEVMKYKSQRNEYRDQLAARDAKDKKVELKKLEEEGKFKEIITEQTSTIESMKSKLESQDVIVNNYKQQLITTLSSDKERQEYLATKPVDFLEELTKEKLSLNSQSVSNPSESLGAVRMKVSNKPWGEMTDAERRDFYTLKANEQVKGI